MYYCIKLHLYRNNIVTYINNYYILCAFSRSYFTNIQVYDLLIYLIVVFIDTRLETVFSRKNVASW